MIYLDYAATTPMSENALKVYNEVSKQYFGNSSSLHDIGTVSKDLLEHCRNELANIIHAPAKGIYFTCGGTESNVLAVKTLLETAKGKGNHIITSAIEHSSLINYFQHLASNHGFKVTYLPVNKSGSIDVKQLSQAIDKQTILVSIQHANSEIGVIQPIEAIGKLLNSRNILFHSDCVQTFGKIPIDVKQLHIDSLSMSSHKIYGPKGVGAVYLNTNLSWNTSAANNNHENGLRPGTVNVPGIAAFVTAAQEIVEIMSNEQARLSHIRSRFIEQVKERKLNVEVLSSEEQMPNIIGLLVDHIQGDYAMLEFNRAGIAVSTGSACSVGQQEPAKTIVAIGIPTERAKQFIRLSLGKATTEEDMDKVIDICEQMIHSYH